MIDLRLPEPIVREWQRHIRAGIPLSEQARSETLAAIQHALAECGCGNRDAAEALSPDGA